eukprot:3981891-Ditylum_brightwellii.AAC.1
MSPYWMGRDYIPLPSVQARPDLVDIKLLLYYGHSSNCQIKRQDNHGTITENKRCVMEMAC